MIIAGIESLIKAKNTPIAMRKWNRCEKCLSLVDQAAKRFGGSMLLSSFLRKYLLTASKKKTDFSKMAFHSCWRLGFIKSDLPIQKSCPYHITWAVSS